MNEIKDSVVILIDDDREDLELARESLETAVKNGELGREISIETYQIFADNRFDEEIDKLMEKIREHIASEEVERVVIAIDLHLMGKQNYTSFDKLLGDAETGLMVKEYIAAELERSNDSRKQADKVKYLFISNYLKAATEIGVTLCKILDSENEAYVAKPGKEEETRKFLKNEGCDIQKCELRDEKIKKIIQMFYNDGTTYSNFIGKILETALS